MRVTTQIATATNLIADFRTVIELAFSEPLSPLASLVGGLGMLAVVAPASNGVRTRRTVDQRLTFLVLLESLFRGGLLARHAEAAPASVAVGGSRAVTRIAWPGNETLPSNTLHVHARFAPASEPVAVLRSVMLKARIARLQFSGCHLGIHPPNVKYVRGGIRRVLGLR